MPPGPEKTQPTTLKGPGGHRHEEEPASQSGASRARQGHGGWAKSQEPGSLPEGDKGTEGWRTGSVKGWVGREPRPRKPLPRERVLYRGRGRASDSLTFFSTTTHACLHGYSLFTLRPSFPPRLQRARLVAGQAQRARSLCSFHLTSCISSCSKLV